MVEPEHHFQRCRNEGLGGDSSSAGYAHHRDAYLLALEECALEVSQLSRELAPFMRFSVCEVPSTGDSREAFPPLLVDLLHPLLSKVGRLHALVKNHFHLRQPAGGLAGGHNASCMQDHQNFVNANREILTEVRREADRAARHSRACHELLSSGLQNFPTNGPTDRTVGGGGFTTMSKKARKRYNWQKQQLFRQREKARRVELAMQAAGVALGPSFVNRESAWWL